MKPPILRLIGCTTQEHVVVESIAVFVVFQTVDNLRILPGHTSLFRVVSLETNCGSVRA